MAFAALAVVLWRLAGLNLMLKATTGPANVSGTEFDWTVGEAGDFKCLKGSISSPVLEKAGFFFWPRVGVSCLPSIFGRGRECVGYRDDDACDTSDASAAECCLPRPPFGP